MPIEAYKKKGIKLLQDIDIGIIPFIGRSFKCSQNLRSLMLIAKPVVAMWGNESEYIVQDGINGFLARDMVEFEEKVCNLIENPTLRYNIGVEAHRSVLEKYTEEPFFTLYTQILEKIFSHEKFI
jgi:glycosyltransferase involved in cell wall biosynthesis